jgi:hypothetical protein
MPNNLSAAIGARCVYFEGIFNHTPGDLFRCVQQFDPNIRISSAA